MKCQWSLLFSSIYSVIIPFTQLLTLKQTFHRQQTVTELLRVYSRPDPYSVRSRNVFLDVPQSDPPSLELRRQDSRERE